MGGERELTGAEVGLGERGRAILGDGQFLEVPGFTQKSSDECFPVGNRALPWALHGSGSALSTWE